MFDVILDCYTDEPSGLGAPPYLSTHSRYLSGVLSMLEREHYYFTIDDVRLSNGESVLIRNSKKINKRVINTTKNSNNVNKLLKEASNIYVIYGCFVKYDYLSCTPPTISELESLIYEYKEKVVLFYCLGSPQIPDELSSLLKAKFNKVYFGEVYNYFIDYNHPFDTNYNILNKITTLSARVLEQINRPLIIELETMRGCNHKPGCSFCIESLKNTPLQFRDESDIVKEAMALNSYGAKYFRLGRQPNFYAYGLRHDVGKLLSNIRLNCPDIQMLHIDNVNPVDVVKDKDSNITKSIYKYCTSGNIAPFGIESFDLKVRKNCHLNGNIEDILNATKIINEIGCKREEGELPRFLPGFNFIYGLDGQGENTLKENLKYLSEILTNGLLVRRTFVRQLTSSFGAMFDKNKSDNEYKNWCKNIETAFSLPMLEKIYPIDMVLTDLRVEMVTEEGTILRAFGTCAERILIRNKFLELDVIATAKITGYLNHRSLIGELL